MKSMSRKNSDFSRGLSRPALSRLRAVRLMGVLILAFSLSACSYVQSAVDYAQSAASQMYAKASQTLTEGAHEASEENSETRQMPKPMASVVLRSAPRYLMVKPRTDPVWLWNKPGGSSSRAVRIRKVPSGTPGKVVEIEPEPNSSAIWAKFNFKNVARQPVRWMKVATLLGVGWVRAEFVEIR